MQKDAPFILMRCPFQKIHGGAIYFLKNAAIADPQTIYKTELEPPGMWLPEVEVNL